MNNTKLKRLEAAGWEVGSAAEFLAPDTCPGLSSAATGTMKAYNSDITIEEFIARHATPYDPDSDNYFREPFARDTKVGKNSAIYNAHSYHTKVPPEGIVPVYPALHRTGRPGA